MSLIENITANYSGSVADRLDAINNRLDNIPKILDVETLDKLKNGEYEVSLREYTDMNSYRAAMTVLYGNFSANRFNSVLKNLFGYNDDFTFSAKNFLDRMEEKGISNGNALKMYTALKTYSVNSSLFDKNCFISAKI